MGSQHFRVGLRSDRPYCTWSRSLEGYFCSWVYGHLSREYSWRSLHCGTAFHNLEIRGVVSCWEPSVLPWPCSDRVLGRSMPAFLDGSASAFEIGSVSPLLSRL